MKLTVVFLTRTSSREIYEMTMKSLCTMMDGADSKLFDISTVIVESDINSAYKYPENVSVITPDENFNFHRFLNHGIKTQSASDWYLLCNNDLIFYPHWLSELEKVILAKPEIESLSPISPTCKEQIRLVKNIDLTLTPFLLGFDRRQHLSGWCFMVKNDTLKKIGGLDERFSFYFADDDYSLSLRRLNIFHALVLNSQVKHLEDEKVSKKIKYLNSNLPQETPVLKVLLSNRYSWILVNDKMRDGFLIYTAKWGDIRLIALKRKLHDFLFLKLGISFFSKYLFKAKC